MTLERRLVIQWVLLLVCLVLTAGVGFWGIRGIKQDFSIALQNQQMIRDLSQVGIYLQSARVAMSGDFPDFARAYRECLKAQEALSQIVPGLPLTDLQKQKLLETIDGVTDRIGKGQIVSVDGVMSGMQQVLPVLSQQIRQAQKQADDRKQWALFLLTGVAGGAILLGVILSILQWRSVMKPLSTISEGVRRIGNGRFDTPVRLSGADREFEQLAEDVEQMARELASMYGQLRERVEASTRAVVQSERLAGVGLLAAGVAHEINNPLAIITGRIELMMASEIDPRTRQSLQIVLDEAFRCKQIITRLLDLSRESDGGRELKDLSEVVTELINNIGLLPVVGNRSIRITTCEPVRFVMDAGQIKQVILNLLINAIQATTDSGLIRVSLRRVGAWAELEIVDDGRGMDPEVLDHLFEPFFSKRPGEIRGTGLGLTISKSIVESHGGTLQASSEGIGKGSRFVARWPIG
jgi:signal transduction histidine kinase